MRASAALVRAAALLASIGTAVVTAAEPQCPTKVDLRSCRASYQSGLLALAEGGSLPPRQSADVLCRPEAQAYRDSCAWTCANRLVVTSPAEYAFTACAQDPRWVPFVPAAHIDENHPLRRTELPLVYIGEGGCNQTLYSREKHAGKIVIVFIGDGEVATCQFGTMRRRAHSVGVAVLLIGFYGTDLNFLPTAIVEPSGGVTVPTMVIPRHHTDLIMEAIAGKGLAVTAYLDVACDASPATPPPSLPVTDNCPSLSLVGKCSNQADPEHRLCNRCPQQLSWGGKSVCLWGNSLVPRDGRNHLRSVLSLPADVTAVYIESPTRIGCTPGEFAGLAGMIVFAEETPRSTTAAICTPMMSARNAAAEGVFAYVSISGKEAMAMAPSGPSQFVSIPVHSTMPSDYDAVRALFHAGTKEAHLPNRPRYVLRNARIVDEAVADPYQAADVVVVTGPQPVGTDDLAAFDWTPAVIVSLVVIVLTTALIGWKLHQQRAEAVVLPTESVGSTFTVPLSVASMGLSISLVLIIAAVAFALAHTAGQSATDSALDDGRAATTQTYRNAQENVQDQARQVTKVVTGRVIAELEKHINKGTTVATESAKVYKDTDASWASWNGKYQQFFDTVFEYCCQNSPEWFGEDWQRGWGVSMTSVNGFFADHRLKTDNRPDADRGDGLQHVSVTQSGWLYGLSFFLPVGPGGRSVFRFPVFPPRMADSPLRRIGQWPGDKLGLAGGKTLGHTTWRVTRNSLPWNTQVTHWFPPNPVSVLTPAYSRTGTFLGVVEAMMDVGIFASLLEEALKSDPALANVTIVVFEKATSNLIVDTNKYYSRVVDQYSAAGAYTPHHQLITLRESLAIENSALSYYLETIPDLAGSHTGQFDQAALYVSSDYHVFDVRASAGGVADVSGNAYGVENHGGSCGGCTASRELWDGRTGEVMVFDGANAMLIYQNLTTDVPHVAATRVGSGAWDSSVPLYKTVRPLAGLGGGTEQRCVTHADVFSPFVGCMLRGHYFDKPYTVFARFKPSADVSEEDRSQQIFTEASAGETSVRMYANGAVAMNVLSYGCVTKPVRGGMKGGEWVSVTFRRTATNCTTFVNGKLWDTGRVVKEYVSDSHGVPFEVGSGFAGEISNLQMLNVTVNEKEAAGLHETDVFVRDVPSKTWLLEIGRIRREDSRSSGLDWSVATMMPQADVMRRVDENNRVTLHNLEVQEDNTKTKLQRKTNETIIVIIAIALVSVFVFLVFNDLLTRPFAQVCVVMADAAVMRIEEIPATSSKILEINAIYRAMSLMTRNLKEYKAYMPQSVLADTDDDSESAVSASKRSPVSSRSRGHADSSAAAPTGERSSMMAAQAGARRVGMALALERRKCTFGVTNLVGFHAKMSGLSEKKVVATHGRVLEAVLSHVQASKGFCDGFSGDRFLAAFNGLKSLASHRVAGCLAGVAVRDALKAEDFETSTAVVCGEARVGNMGCEVMRKYTFVSPVLSWGYALERYARAMSCAVVSDHFIAPDVAQQFVVRTVGQVLFEKRLAKGKPITVSCVLEQHQAGEGEEWMYALSEIAAADPQAAWNKFADAVFDQNWRVWRVRTRLCVCRGWGGTNAVVGDFLPPPSPTSLPASPSATVSAHRATDVLHKRPRADTCPLKKYPHPSSFATPITPPPTPQEAQTLAPSDSAAESGDAVALRLTQALKDQKYTPDTIMYR